MVWCNHCGKNVPGIRPYGGALACNLCGRVLENFNFSTEFTFVKNAAGQSQASGHVVRSVQSGISSSRERRIRIARDDFMNQRDALGIGDERDDVIDMATRFFTSEIEPDYSSVSKSEKRYSEKGEGGKDGDDGHAEASDESGNFSDVRDTEVDRYINNEEEKRLKKVIWEEMNKEYLKKQADKEAALNAANDALNESNSNFPRKLVESSKAAVAKSRKRLSGLINYDVLEELFDTTPDEEYPKRSKTETVMEKKKKRKRK